MQQPWRVMGLWEDGTPFLVVLGRSAKDCVARLPEAIDHLSHEEFKNVWSLWLEQWHVADLRHRRCHWVPMQELTLRKLRLRKAARMPPAR